MARIRTLKPELPQSQSMGRVSRDARLLFILLWTTADDAGRLRGDSRMLARTLYPYDDGEDGNFKTSRADVASWLDELEKEGCLRCYRNDDADYIQICNWLKHQKIDKPSASKLPGPEDPDSIFLSNPRESSSGDLDLEGNGSRKGSGSISSASPPQPRKTVPRETPPDPEWWLDFKLAYPSRAGDQGWRRAQKAANARIAEGHTPTEFTEGARRYAAYCDAVGNSGTEYVKQAATFLGPDKPFLLPWTPPASKAQRKQDRNIDAGLEWLEQQEAADKLEASHAAH